MKNNRCKRITTLLIGWSWILASLAASNRVTVEVKTNRLSETPVSRYIFGNFVEAGFGRQVSGIWAEKIYNRSFLLPQDYPSFGESDNTIHWWMFPASMYNEEAPFWHSGYEENQWYLTDPGPITLSRTRGTESYKGLSSLLMSKDTEVRGGIAQDGIWLKAGETYTFSLTGGFLQAGHRVGESLPGFAQVTPAETHTKPFEMILREEANPENILFRQVFDLRGYQQPFSCSIPDLGFTGAATLELVYGWKGVVVLSCCSLMPDHTVNGWRPDVVELLKELRVPVIRYPGGCYASFYDWRKYVGPRDTRETSASFFWGSLDDNDASIDEFLELCDAVGCEPQICINMMSSTPFKAAEFVEYLNGGEDTPMGRFRQENGVTRSRKVRLFEMDNEAGRKWNALEYARQVVLFSDAMRAVDPDIELMMMCYSFDHEEDYFEQMLEIAGQHIEYVIFRNGSPAFVNRILQNLRKYNEANGTSVRLTNTEWLAGGSSPEPFADPEIPQHHAWSWRVENNYKKVLSYRQIHWFYALNAAEQLLDYLSYGGEFYLSNFNNCVNTWGQNVIESSKQRAWLSPTGEVFRFFRSQQETYPLQTTLTGGRKNESQAILQNTHPDIHDVNFPLQVNLQSQTDFYKVQACETVEGIHLYFINKSGQEVQLKVLVPAGYQLTGIEDLSAPDRLSRTALNHSDITTSQRKIKGNPVLKIKPLSVNRICLEKK
ncbi:MAG: hypothetical protein LUG98_11775 [Tannerellaceae bacterium]|nr:hypothetical protein [Tannerellaceae bacterium]